MDILPLNKAMNTLIEDLVNVRAEHCSDEFLTTLNTFIEKTSKISADLHRLKIAEGTSRKRRRLTNASSSSDDLRYIPTELVTVDLVSDSEESASQIASDSSTSEASRPAPTPKELNVNEVLTKRCVVKLQRIRFIGGLEQNVIAPTISSAAKNQDDLEQNENKKTSWQVSITENANKISDENLKPIVIRYTYEDYRKRYQDVCCTQ